MSGLTSGIVGIQTQAAQPAFLAKPNSNANARTGAGTVYTVVFDSETFDQNADFDGSTTFTAPVTGKYLLCAVVDCGSMTSAATDMEVFLVTSLRTHRAFLNDNNGLDNSRTLQINVVADMDASDTATVTAEVTGEASDVVLISANNTRWSGCLLA